jgi:hypothetical protein
MVHFLGVVCIGGHRHRPSCRQYPTSDVDISYSDIGTKYVGLNPHIPISEEFRYRQQLPFRYRTKSISDIPVSKIDKSILKDPSKFIVDSFLPLVSNSQHLWQESSVLLLCFKGLQTLVSDIGYQTKVYPISDIMSDFAHFSPISDIPISGSVRYR